MTTIDRVGVSVIIPCYNQSRFLAGAIDSAIAQTTPPREIIVVDDGSTEDVGAIASAYQEVRLIRQHNRGLAGARNSGLRAAANEKLIFLDADDLLLPSAIESGIACFDRNPAVAFVYGAHRIVRGEQRSRTYYSRSTHAQMVACNWVGMVATAMFDRARLLEIGGFDESLGMCEDWDAYLRLSRAFPFASHDDLVADYIRHAGNASNDLHRLWKWIEVVRTKEWERGIDAEGRRAWHKGLETWERMLGPDPGCDRPIGRAKRELSRIFRRQSR